MTKEEIQTLIRDELARYFAVKTVYSANLQLLDGRNIQVGKTTGTSLGTETSQKIAVYGGTPVVQASAISAPSGGGTQDAEARTAINSIRTALQNFGITA